MASEGNICIENSLVDEADTNQRDATGVQDLLMDDEPNIDQQNQRDQLMTTPSSPCVNASSLVDLPMKVKDDQ